MSFDLWSLLRGASDWASRAFSTEGSGTNQQGTRGDYAVSGGAGAGGGNANLSPSGVVGGMVGGFGGLMDWKGAGFGGQAGGKLTNKEGEYVGGHIGGGAGAGYATWENAEQGARGASGVIGGVAPVGVSAGNKDIQGSLDTNVYRAAGGSVYEFDKGGAKGYGADANYVPVGLADSKLNVKTDYGTLDAGVDNAYYGKLSGSAKMGVEGSKYFADATGSSRMGLDGGKIGVDTPIGNAGASIGHASYGTTVTGGGSYDAKTGAAEIHGGGYTGAYGKDIGFTAGTAGGDVKYSGGIGSVKYGYEADAKLGWDPTKQQVTLDGGGRGGGVQLNDMHQKIGVKGVGSYESQLGGFSNDVIVKDVHGEFGRDSSKISVGTLDGGGVRFNDAKVAAELGDGAVKANAGFGSLGSTNSINDAYLQANYKSLEDASLKAGFSKLSYGGWSGENFNASLQGPGGLDAKAKLGSFNQGLVMENGKVVLDKNGLNAAVGGLQYDTLNLKDIDLNAKLGDIAAVKGSLGEFGTNHVKANDLKAGLNWDQGLYASAKDARYDSVYLDKLKYEANVGDFMKSKIGLGEGYYNHFSGKNIAANIDSSGAHAKLEDGKYRYLGGKDISLDQSYLGGNFGYGASAKEASVGGVDIGKLQYDTNFRDTKLAVENLGAHGFKSKDIELHQNIGALGGAAGAKELNALDLNIGKLKTDVKDFGLSGNVDVQKANLDLLNIKGGHAGLSWDGKEVVGASGDYRSGAGVDSAKGNWDVMAGKAAGQFKNANYGMQLDNASINLFGNKLALPDAGFKLNASGGGDVDLSRGAANANLSLGGTSANFAGYEVTLPDWVQGSAGVDLSQGAANFNLGGENGVGADLNLAEGNLDIDAFGYRLDVDEGIRAAGEGIADAASYVGGGIADAASAVGSGISDAAGAVGDFISSLW